MDKFHIFPTWRYSDTAFQTANSLLENFLTNILKYMMYS